MNFDVWNGLAVWSTMSNAVGSTRLSVSHYAGAKKKLSINHQTTGGYLLDT
jgi:hypothetical protein